MDTINVVEALPSSLDGRDCNINKRFALKVGERKFIDRGNLPKLSNGHSFGTFRNLHSFHNKCREEIAQLEVVAPEAHPKCVALRVPNIIVHAVPAEENAIGGICYLVTPRAATDSPTSKLEVGHVIVYLDAFFTATAFALTLLVVTSVRGDLLLKSLEDIGTV